MSETGKTAARKREIIGRVVSTKMLKTIVVLSERRVAMGMVGKPITRSKKYKAHDEGRTAKDGDMVRIRECRPLSRDKHFRLVEIIQRGIAE